MKLLLSTRQIHEFPFMFLLAHLLLALEDFFPWSQRKAGKEKIRAGGQQSAWQCSCFPSDTDGFGISFWCVSIPPRADIAGMSDAFALQEMTIIGDRAQNSLS